MSISRRFIFLATALTAALGAVILSFALPATIPVHGQGEQDAVKRGQYLVTIIGCAGCHGDPKIINDPKLIGKPEWLNVALSGGQAFDLGPVGTFYGANLTGDPDTGLGKWTAAQIVTALRNGVGIDGKVLAPVMPSSAFNGMTDDDVNAIAAYLKTLAPVNNKVPDNKPGPVYNFLKPLPVIAVKVPVRNASATYGAYLVQHVNTCGSCHGTRDARGQIVAGHELAGGNQPLGGGPGAVYFAPPITGTVLNAEGYTKETFLTAMKTGVRPWGAMISPVMPWLNYSQMTDNDVNAIWAYLQTVRQPRPLSQLGVPAS